MHPPRGGAGGEEELGAAFVGGGVCEEGDESLDEVRGQGTV